MAINAGFLRHGHPVLHRNDDLGNLVAPCQRCHLLSDAPDHRKRRAATVRARRACGDLFEGPY